LPAIELDGVLFGYDGGSPLLNIHELEIHEGERVFMHGPSGSGKTTLLGLISGVLKATRGSVRVLDRDLSEMSLSARDRHRGAEMGYIFQGLNLVPYLSVSENIALPCNLYAKRMRRISSSSLDQEIRRLAERLDFRDLLDRPVTKLSTGQQQRVAIARAIIGQPRLVIADEPTSSLDRDRQEGFLQLLMEMCDEASATLLFVSHDLSLMHRFHRNISLKDVNTVSA